MVPEKTENCYVRAVIFLLPNQLWITTETRAWRIRSKTEETLVRVRNKFLSIVPAISPRCFGTINARQLIATDQASPCKKHKGSVEVSCWWKRVWADQVLWSIGTLTPPVLPQTSRVLGDYKTSAGFWVSRQFLIRGVNEWNSSRQSTLYSLILKLVGSSALLLFIPIHYQKGW